MVKAVSRRAAENAERNNAQRSSSNVQRNRPSLTFNVVKRCHCEPKTREAISGTTFTITVGKAVSRRAAENAERNNDQRSSSNVQRNRRSLTFNVVKRCHCEPKTREAISGVTDLSRRSRRRRRKGTETVENNRLRPALSLSKGLKLRECGNVVLSDP